MSLTTIQEENEGYLAFEKQADLFYKVFEAKSQLKKDDLIELEKTWIFIEINKYPREVAHVSFGPEENAADKREHALIDAYQRCRISSTNRNVRVSIFVNEIIDAIYIQHVKLKDVTPTISENIVKLKECQKTLDFLRYDNSTESFRDQPNKIFLSYVQDEFVPQPVQEFYEIRIKVSTTIEDIEDAQTLTRFEDQDRSGCSFVIDHLQKYLFFTVFGRRQVEPGASFEVISKVTLPVDEIFSSMPINSLREKVISPVFLEVPYFDNSKSPLTRGENIMEIRFELYMNTQTRLRLADQFLSRWQSSYEKKLRTQHEAQKQIKELLLPFQPTVSYSVEQGLFQGKEKENFRVCASDLNCNLM
eukprot:TRINITY_DN1054_c0_g1_i21.p1 TRINITY_DN1054_c0_g1~~TRINITY_DN1054_c0_g1_i21.p1  ORF type:complete len:361 (+),score=45.65 TRINITY_DN1054_c0_g1_i21:35-1117(+)